MFNYWKIKIFGPLVLAVLFANFVIPPKDFTLLDQARNFTYLELHYRASDIYFKLLSADPNNIELHREIKGVRAL